MRKEKPLLVVVAVALAIVAVILAAAALQQTSPNGIQTTNGTVPTAPVPEGTPPTTSPPPADAKLSLDYTEAVNLYMGHTIAFSGCQGTPGTLLAPVGTTYLLDNRDNKVRTIMVGETKYTLGAYGFRVVNAGSKKGMFQITCDGGGAAKLDVQ